jgi:hypothetical protein
MEGRKGIELMNKLLALILSAIVVASLPGVASAATNVIYIPKFGYTIMTNSAANEQQGVKTSYQMHNKQLKQGTKNDSSTPYCVCSNSGKDK